MKKTFQREEKNFGLIIKGFQTIKLKNILNIDLYFLIIKMELKVLKSTFNHICNYLL